MTVKYIEANTQKATTNGDVVFQSDTENWTKIIVTVNGDNPGDESGVFIGIALKESPDGAFGSEISSQLDREDAKKFAATVLEAAGLDVPKELR